MAVMLIILFFVKNCKEAQNPVPTVAVNITIDLNGAEFNDLVPGSHKNITGGLSGIILYRRTFEDFIALERTCPYEAEYGTRVSVLDNHYTLECSTCGSQFSIDDGGLIQGPSEFPLRTYNTSFDGRYLRIYN